MQPLKFSPIVEYFRLIIHFLSGIFNYRGSRPVTLFVWYIQLPGLTACPVLKAGLPSLRVPFSLDTRTHPMSQA